MFSICVPPDVVDARVAGRVQTGLEAGFHILVGAAVLVLLLHVRNTRVLVFVDFGFDYVKGKW